MSYNDRPIINGSFSGNVNSGNVVFGGDPRAWHGMMSGMMKGYADNGGPPDNTQDQSAGQRVQTDPMAPSQSQPTGQPVRDESVAPNQNQSAGRRVRTEPVASSPAQSRYLGVNNFTGSFPFFPGRAIFGEPRPGTPSPAPSEAEVYSAPVRELPAWKFNYEIGHGAFGTVFLEKVQTRGMDFPELWAVKRIPKAVPNFPARRYQEEIRNLQALSTYEWFVKFNCSYEDDHFVYIAMEYFPIGDMLKTFEQNYRWNESDTKVVIEQLLRGLVVMHNAGITHRDLKPENIFLCLPEGRNQDLRVKIGDFGTSKRIPHLNASTYLKTSAGTQGYMAPEMEDTSNPKTNRVDIWSLGCILYQMLAGSPLFNSRREVWRYSDSASSPPQAVRNRGFSVPCVDFLGDVLQPEPRDRPSAEDCLKKPWITNKASGSEYSIGSDLYGRLNKILRAAPDIDSLSDKVADRAVDNPLAGGFPVGMMPMADSMANSLKSVNTFDTGSSRTAVPH